MILGLSCLMLCAWLVPSGKGVQAASGFMSELTSAEVIVTAYRPTTALPSDTMTWQPFSFSQLLPNPTFNLITVWFRVRFDLEEHPEALLKLYLPRFYHGGQIYLNDTLVGQIPGSDPETQGRWLRPHLVVLPLDTLHTGENTLLLRVDSRWPNIGIATPVIGTAEQILPRYWLRYFIEKDLIAIVVTMLLLGGLFLLAIWVRRRKEVTYALFGLAMLAWGLRTAYNLWPLIPIEYWVLSRGVFYALTGFGNILLVIFILRTAEIYRPWLERLALVYAALGPAAVLVMREGFVQWDGLWYLGAMPLNIFAVLAIMYAAWRYRTWDRVALAVGISLGVAAFVHDSLLQAGWLAFPGFYLSYVAVPLILVTMGMVLIARFTDALEREENISHELAERVAQRELELAASYESLRSMATEQARANERQRIMGDMHDGLGSQLLSSLVMVESGNVDQKYLAQILRECIDDMRMVIDTLSPDGGDLITALGTLRFRMGPRLHAAGIHLEWNLRGSTESCILEPQIALAILRIVQEGLSNALQHSGATQVTFTLEQSADTIHIHLRDNGQGFDAQQQYAGRGLSNLQRRATAIGAELKIESNTTGTVMQLNWQP